VAEISRGLKILARELQCPVVGLSQLSRNLEMRQDKRPMLSDLRESGAIEQDADIVSFIYRPEYYGLTEWDDDERTPCEGQAEFIVAKHRNGGLENIKIKFIGRLAKFTDLDEGFGTEFQSSMNQDAISPDNFASANDAFGKMNTDDDDAPF
jgi:replicative DNA helicase